MIVVVLKRPQYISRNKYDEGVKDHYSKRKKQ